MRLDAYIASKVPECSRSYATQLIRQGRIQVDGAQSKPSYKIKTSEQVIIAIPPSEPVELAPEPMALDIKFEDRHLIVLNKPPGLVVHPAAGHPRGTLVNGILHHCPDLEGIGGEIRPGIVHRLDKDTSGIIVVAKTDTAHQGLSEQFKSRSVVKRYYALVHGHPDKQNGYVDLPIGRHPADRKKMSTASPRGREALTLWRIKERYANGALLEIELKTGRTHQIRVHCRSMGHPIIGDQVYGARKSMSNLSKRDMAFYQVVKKARRQMLHAFQLGFLHPVTAKRQHFEAPFPEDMAVIIKNLKHLS